VVDRLGSDQWSRLRIGIGAALGDPTVHVLTRFDEEEKRVMRRARDFAAEAVECWIEHGVDLAMTRYNGDPPPI
jgi:PTH1 family peptidyl-tRNA hydrolase